MQTNQYFYVGGYVLLGIAHEMTHSSTILSIKDIFTLAARLEGLPRLPLRQFYLIMMSIVNNFGQGIGLFLGPIIYVVLKHDIERFLWTIITICILWSITLLAFTRKDKINIMQTLMDEEINIPLSSVASLSENRPSEVPIIKEKFDQAEKLL